MPDFLNIEFGLNDLLIVGGIIALGLLAGKAAKLIKLPKVTGYLLAGLIIGPSLLGWLNEGTIHDLRILTDIALGLILFTIGGEFNFARLKNIGLKYVYLTLAEGFGAMILVFIGLMLAGLPWNESLLIGAIAIATAPAATLLVLWEFEARGPLTDAIMSVVAYNNVLCILMFRLALVFTDVVHGYPPGEALLVVGYQVIGSVVLGVVIGMLVGFSERFMDSTPEVLLVIIGGVLVSIGLSDFLNLFPMLACMAVGATVMNISPLHRLLFVELRSMELPFYIAFFVLAGATLHIESLAYLGIPGAIYIFARFLGKWSGASITALALKLPQPVYRYLGWSLAPQAGVAIGLATMVADRHPNLGATVTTIIFAAVILYETIGPPITRLTVKLSGEGKVK